MTDTERSYVELARDLADVLMDYARERCDEDRKLIAELHLILCKLRRGERALGAAVSRDASATAPPDSKR